MRPTHLSPSFVLAALRRHWALTRHCRLTGHWVLTDSHPCANVRRFIHHLAHLAGVHKYGALFPSRRAPRCGRTAERRVSTRRGRAGENNSLFDHPAGTWYIISDSHFSVFLSIEMGSQRLASRNYRCATAAPARERANRDASLIASSKLP
jgi:hypothetical protein